MTDRSAFIPSPMPKSSGKYLRVGDIKTRPNRCVRISFVSPPVEGLEKWTENNKPVRIAPGASFPSGVKWRKDRETGMEEAAKSFRAAGVFNWDDNDVQLFSWTQKKLNARLIAKLSKAKDPRDVVLTVTALEVTPADYDVDAEKAEPYTPEQRAKIDDLLSTWTGPVALFNGGDPFAPFGDDVVRDKGEDGDIPF